MDFNQTFQWVLDHSYPVIFLVMCVEGPMTTAAAGFASALGYFDPFIILILSILGDLVPDALYYWFGYVSRFSYIRKIGEKLGFNQARIEKTEDKLRKHFGKTMVVFKLTPGVSTLAFMLVGYLKLSFRRFMALCSAVTVPKSIIFLLIGYYFGRLYNINEYLHKATLILPMAAILGVIVYIGYNKISRSVTRKVEKI